MKVWNALKKIFIEVLCIVAAVILVPHVAYKLTLGPIRTHLIDGGRELPFEPRGFGSTWFKSEHDLDTVYWVFHVIVGVLSLCLNWYMYQKHDRQKKT